MVVQPTEPELAFNRPPIVEAVIERRFVAPFEPKVMNALRKKFERDYPAVTQMAELEVSIGPDPSHQEAKQRLAGYKMVNRAGTATILVTQQAIGFARMAPYPGWGEFSAGATDTFQTARDVMGYASLNRLGVRYINRLDIKIEDPALPLRLEDYILIYIQVPEHVIPPLTTGALQCVSVLPGIECRLTINVASVLPSPVPHHRSFVFDIDIAREAGVPQREDEIAPLLESIRREKNRIFVSCLTDKMKESFD